MLDRVIYKMYEEDFEEDEALYDGDFEDEEDGNYYNGYDDDDYQNPDFDYEEE
ncbi:hypothetical protein [Helicobacter mustelae]|uniref:Highly acidic protein n=1 Tax=Helicobacter mustelae (strain ATCC 43772 / CCUG 25715 / CIP 103759 / LMG 18044 / NCTC 12198 / R85-136P) TaxID=679897 RepID=D3UH89_HELM1|nr:hypothetical protein [Helicobacter mustelae]CBG39861.1 highly acidic protein [Helicobacter mustelae 12198]SQH71371.1 highly acidic protein [Helicobacter mustelae]STP12498.1 highly acidic protein [Helicobacter mustelae]